MHMDLLLTHIQREAVFSELHSCCIVNEKLSLIGQIVKWSAEWIKAQTMKACDYHTVEISKNDFWNHFYSTYTFCLSIWNAQQTLFYLHYLRDTKKESDNLVCGTDEISE